MTTHKIGYYFDSSESLRTLARHAAQLASLQDVFMKVAPQALTQACCVKQLRSGTLVLLAGNAAVAAKLKQLAPRLLTAYEKSGAQVTSIRVEVQVAEPTPGEPQRPGKKRLSIESIEHLERLTQELEDSSLKRALINLAENQRRKGLAA